MSGIPNVPVKVTVLPVRVESFVEACRENARCSEEYETLDSPDTGTNDECGAF